MKIVWILLSLLFAGSAYAQDYNRTRLTITDFAVPADAKGTARASFAIENIGDSDLPIAYLEGTAIVGPCTDLISMRGLPTAGEASVQPYDLQEHGKIIGVMEFSGASCSAALLNGLTSVSASMTLKVLFVSTWFTVPVTDDVVSIRFLK